MRGDIRQTISASGVLAGKDSASLKFKKSGKLAYVNVKVGEEVEKGEVLAGLDTQDLDIALRQAELDYNAKKASAQKAEDDVKDHDDDETYTQKETRTKAQAAQNIAFDSVKEAKRTYQDAIIASPIDGIITQVNFVAGQNVSVTDLVIQVIDKSEVMFEAEVDEADIGKIALGQKVEVSLNSYPDRFFSGEIIEITPITKTTTSGATVIVVKIKLDNPTINFIANTNGQAEIIIKESKRTLKIPQESLKEGREVLVKNGQNYQTIKVDLGVSSDEEIEVLSGLQEGSEIVTNPEAVKPKSSNPILRFLNR